MFLGILCIIAAAGLFYFLWRTGSRMEEAQFNRTNEAGVEEFENYKEMRGTRVKEHLFSKLVAPPVFLASFGLFIYGVVRIFF